MEKQFYEILNANPAYLGIHSALGWFLYYDLGREEEAKDHFEYVIHRHKVGDYDEKDQKQRWDIAMAYAGMGGIVAEEKNYKLAESFYLLSLDILPTPVAYSQMGLLTKNFRKDFDFAVKFHRKALSLDPRGESEKIEIAINYLYQKQKKKAEEMIKEINSNSSQHSWELARFHAMLGDVKKVILFLESYLAQYSSRPLREKQILDLILEEEDLQFIKGDNEFLAFIEAYQRKMWTLTDEINEKNENREVKKIGSVVES